VCKAGVCSALVLLLGGSCAAQQYSFRHYGFAEGLQNLAVLALAQDGAGFLWAGSEAGLYRYDGTVFRLMGAAEGLPCATEVHALQVAADGALWANACSKIFRFDGQRFTPVSGLNGMLTGAQGMAEDAQGRMLVASPSGLYRVDQDGAGSLTAHPYPLGPALAGMPMHGIARNGSELWFGCGRGLCVEDNGRVSIIGAAEGLPDDAWDAIRVAADGSVWVRSSSKLYRKRPGLARVFEEEPNVPSSMFWGALTIARDGSVMVPTDNGLAIGGKGRWSLIDERGGLHAAMTSAVVEDREGSLWIALVGAGVARLLGYGEWEAWTRAQGLPSDLIWSIRRDRAGALWVGTSMGLARLEGGLPARSWTRKDGLGGDNVRWLGETSDGAIWAVVKPGGVARIDPRSGRIRLIGRANGLACASSHRGIVDRLGRLWLATACGAFRNEQPQVSDRFHRIDEPPSLDRGAWAFAEDRQGGMWITNADGLWRLSDGRWRQYRRADGLLSDNPYIPTIGPDGALWVNHRYDAGIERVKLESGSTIRSTAILKTDVSSVDVTAFHGFDAAKRLWRGSANGVSVLIGGKWRYLSMEDGLIWNDTDGQAFWADPDGSVWIGTSGGLAHYRPRNGSLTAPQVADPAITNLVVDQKSRVLRAEFSSLKYKYEQLVRFAYRLDDGPWTETRERIVSVAGLGPGRHRLEIRSRVRAEPYSAKVAAAEFQVDPRWWEIWWVRLGSLLVGAGVLWGVTTRYRKRQLERAVRQRTAELEGERSRMLEEKRQADEARDAKGRFLANISHEIRTPLNGVIGLSRLLEAMPVPPEAVEAIRMIRSSGDTLLRLINDVLDFSKVDAGRLELEIAPFHLRRALEESVGLFRAVAAEKALQLRCALAPDLPEYVAGDETRLRQVVLNLVSNAVKFTASGEVALSAAAERQDEAACAIRVEVRDTGVGIAPEQRARLFSSFYQADSSISRRYGGTGLGLAISQRLVTLMGGSIDVESWPGKGTRFWFTIPLGRAQAPGAPSAAPPPVVSAGRQLRVLVAEDNLVNQKVVLMLLKKLGVAADLAADGAEAIEAAQAKRYDLVLMDVQMPNVSGIAATREIRSRLPRDRQPIIFGLTAHATTEYRDICLAAGMDGYLTKPLEQEKLRNLIAEMSAQTSSRNLAASVTAGQDSPLPAAAIEPAKIGNVTLSVERPSADRAEHTLR